MAAMVTAPGGGTLMRVAYRARTRIAARGMRNNRAMPAAPATSSTQRHAGLPGLIALAAVALLGNGLKAIVTSSVLVSEGTFAALLRMSPEQVAALMEATIAGMVVALAVCPILLQRMTPRRLALAACAAAVAAFAGFALVELGQPSQAVRATAAFIGLAVGAGALALLAPTAQSLVALAPTRGARTSLTTAWTGAAPAGFLVAPQLAKVALPALGLGGYFLAFATLPLLLAVVLVALPFLLATLRTSAAAPASVPTRLALAFVALVVAFEVWTSAGSVVGYARPLTLVAMGVCIACAFFLRHAARRTARPPSLAGPAAWLLLALFVLEMPTTGFFDTAFLVERHYAEAFIADRATFGAAAQIAGTLAAGALVHRLPAIESALRLAFAAIAAVGVALLAGYPWIAAAGYLFAAPMVEGFGAAGLTVLVCLALVREAGAHPLLAAFPSMAIMLGTEFGLELLQLAFAAAGSAGLDAQQGYALVFAAQAFLALAVPVLLLVAARRERAA